jgi:hypothetical protein
MPEPDRPDGADELLRRALIDAAAAAALALPVEPLPLSEAVTIIFHGRRDLGTIQTYVARGRHGTGSSIPAASLLRVPCDLDLAEAEDREEAERLYAEQARALRDALVGAETVLDLWREELAVGAGQVRIDTGVELPVPLPAHRLAPIALVAPERGLIVAPVCGARPLAHGRPPLGIACVQQDVARVYPLPDDPERCLEDFFALATDRALDLASELTKQEASVERFLDLAGEDPPAAA